MSGLGGHIPHIYEDCNLRLSELKSLLRELFSGQMSATEKIDGQNLYVSYSLPERCAKAARNLSNIKSGGLTSAQLAEKFSGRGNVEEAFNDAFARFEQVVSLMTEAEIESIFGADAGVYYNVEVLDPRTSNVIEYDNKVLVIQRTKHKSLTHPARFDLLEGALGRVESRKHSVVVNEEVRIPSIEGDFCVDRMCDEVTAVFAEQGLAEDSRISDLIISRCLPDVLSVGLSREKTAQVLKRIVTGNTPNLNEIKKGLDPKIAKTVSEMVRNRSTRRNSTLPLERIIHKHSVVLLSQYTSAFSKVDHRKGLSERFMVAKKGIEESQYQKAKDILEFNLSQIPKIDDVAFGCEGFVFSHGDNEYKITGNFAPVNQILGLYTFGRGEVPPLKESVKIKIGSDQSDPPPGYDRSKEVVDTPNQKIVVFPGAFRPPHMGHLKVVEHFLEDEAVDKVVVLISNPDSDSSKRSIPFGREITANDSKEIWEKMVSGNPKVEVVVSGSPSPITSAFEYIGDDGIAPKNATILLAVGQKGGDENRFRSVEKYVRGDLDVVVSPIPSVCHSISYLHNLSQDKEILNNMPCLVRSLDPKDFHASDMRYLVHLAHRGSKNAVFLLSDFLPPNVIEYVLRLFSMDLQEDFQSKVAKPRLKKSHKRLLDKGRKDLVKFGAPFTEPRVKKSNAFVAKEGEDLEEVSSMASGAVSGYAAPISAEKKGKKKKKKK